MHAASLGRERVAEGRRDGAGDFLMKCPRMRGGCVGSEVEAPGGGEGERKKRIENNGKSPRNTET